MLMPKRAHDVHSQNRFSGRCRGWTLVELLVVVAITGILLVLLLPALHAARSAARRTHCTNNLRQIGLGLHSYHSGHATFPAGCAERFGRRHAWSTFVLPYIDQQPVLDAFDFDYGSRTVENRYATTVAIRTYLCPSTARRMWDRRGNTVGDKNENGSYDAGDGMACTDYGGVFGDGRPNAPPMNGIMLFDRTVSIDQILDGTSHTVIVAEDSGRGWVADGEWANGENIFDVSWPINRVQHNEVFSDHPGGAYFLLADGSVHFVEETIAMAVVGAFCTRSGKESEIAR